MKPVITLLAFLICIKLFACNKSDEITTNSNNTLDTSSMKLKITVGTNTFTATLFNNATVNAFKARLPLTLNMTDLNSNEKYFDLPNNLTTNASNPGSIQAGDLMLYGSNTLVLFYKSFSTSYSYTPMGRIDNISGLTAALGSSNVTVRFELQ
jgi:hypothetical protein